MSNEVFVNRALTVTDERRIIGHLITGFLHKVGGFQTSMFFFINFN